ncbi:MAG: hydrogenase expression/formation protein HypE, partial [Akkermansia sp.]|nr:hydrogenase expression/formation protein HypE [Akkermansia sp.]
VTGDTKVVERGKGDGIYINTAGVGAVPHDLEISPASVRPGDVVLLSGDLGRHGMTIMGLRSGLSFGEDLCSDSAPLHESVAALIRAGIPVHCLRDVTRGGLTATLSEIAEASGLTVKLDEMSIPVRDDVRAACGLLGLDPLQVACEGRYLAILPGEYEDEALRLMRSCSVSSGACLVGRAEEFGAAPLLMKGRLGVERVLGMPSGMQLPRIC